MEGESLRADPGVLDAVLAVVEHLAVELGVCVVAGLLSHAVELGLLEQLGQTVGLLLLVFVFHLLQMLLLQL